MIVVRFPRERYNFTPPEFGSNKVKSAKQFTRYFGFANGLKVNVAFSGKTHNDHISILSGLIANKQ